MTELVDLMTASQDVVVALLKASPAAELGSAWHSPKQDMQPPFYLVGDMTSEPIGGKDDQVEKITLELQSIYRGRDRGQLLAMLHAGRAALDRVTTTVDGVRFEISWAGGGASTAAADGQTFAGINTFEIYAEPA